METSKSKVYPALVKAINELENPKNSVDNKYYNSKYVPLSDILDIAKPVLSKHGLAIIQTPYVMYETIRNVSKKGEIYHTEIGVVKVTTKLIHESGEILDFPPVVFKASGNTPQHIGSALTYARRYSITSILGIAGKEEDDDGNIGSNVPNNPNNQQQQQVYQQYQQDVAQQQQQQTQTLADPNVSMSEHEAAVVEIVGENQSQTGNPYVDLVIEKDGKRLSVYARNKAYEVAKTLKVGQVAKFKILSAKGFHFVEEINLQGANA